MCIVTAEHITSAHSQVSFFFCFPVRWLARSLASAHCRWRFLSRTRTADNEVGIDGVWKGLDREAGRRVERPTDLMRSIPFISSSAGCALCSSTATTTAQHFHRRSSSCHIENCRRRKKQKEDEKKVEGKRRDERELTQADRPPPPIC